MPSRTFKRVEKNLLCAQSSIWRGKKLQKNVRLCYEKIGKTIVKHKQVNSRAIVKAKDAEKRFENHKTKLKRDLGNIIKELNDNEKFRSLQYPMKILRVLLRHYEPRAGVDRHENLSKFFERLYD